MENNTTDSGGRVTRSLRKRITSVDNDNSSRPGTPAAPKLSSITEISASPSRSTRMSRRNSSSGIATPVKTPAKRPIGASNITESAEISTPSRRCTRRRSISTNEEEAMPQTSLKLPSFPALSEEILSIETNSLTTKKITGSQSKSPQLIRVTSLTPSIHNCSNKVENIGIEDYMPINNSPKRRKPGPKCKTRKDNEADEVSDVEISVLEKGIDEIKMKSSNITTIILTDDDYSNQINANIEIVKEQKDKSAEGDSTENITNMPFIMAENTKLYDLKGDAFSQKENTNDDLEESVGSEKLIEKESNNNESIKQNKKHSNYENKFLSNTSTLIENVNKEVNPSSDGSQKKDSKNTDESMVVISEKTCVVSKSDVEEETMGEVSNKCIDKVSIEHKKQQAVLQEEKTISTGSFFSREIPSGTAAELLEQQKEKVSDNKVEIINICTLAATTDIDETYLKATDYKTSAKTVDFASNLDSDLSNKNVYPKTPVPPKTKCNPQNNDSFRARSDVPDENISQVDVNSNVAVNISEKKTTPRGSHVQNILRVQSSTPISVDTLTYVSIPEIKRTAVSHDKSQNAEYNHTQVEKENLKYSAAQADSVEGEIQMKWINPSVKGASMEDSKIDVMSFIENENIIQEISDVENDDSNNQNVEDSEDEELESVENEYKREDDFIDDDDDDELIIENKGHERVQDDFLDDEAMAVEDYESGDSMESEERKEIMDNEILVDGESIGSHTTDDENDERIEEEHSENDDSFIVSDNEDDQFSEDSDENKQTDSNIDADNHRSNTKKKKNYKRLQYPTESSSSDDEVEKCQLDVKTTEENIRMYKSDESENNSIVNIDSYKDSEKSSKHSSNPTIELSEHHLLLGSCQVSESALRLHCSSETETEEQKIDKEIDNVSHKHNHSDRFNNRSVLDLNLEIETSSTKDIIEVKKDINEIKIIKEDIIFKNSGEKNIKEQLLEESVIMESDDNKENETKSLPNSKILESGLSTSFDISKTFNGREEKDEQYSVSPDMIPKSEELHIKSEKMSISISPSPTDDNQTMSNIKKDNVKYLENTFYVPLPLVNPLVRTRRQSLALPTNPNMEIRSSYESDPNTKNKRKSLGNLPNCDFNPSQSLIDTIELHKSHNNRKAFKRKRMSKSFCGASETLDNSVIDIDVQHLNKRSKIISEKSIVESSDNTSTKVKASKLPSKTNPTSCQKGIKNDSKFNIQTILNRCDEILEAANQTKREAKTNWKKRNIKLSNKQRKSAFVPSLETNQDDVLRRTSKDFNRKDKTKIAVTQAIKAAEKLLTKRRLENEITLQRLPSEELEVVEKLKPKKKLNEKEIGNKQKKKPYQTTVTAIGDFMEIPQTPEKKIKEPTYIQLPTGKVSVEPATPKKRSVQAFNGTEFRESPVTPHPTGFKVRKIPLVSNNTLIGEKPGKVAKRKQYYDEHFKQNILPKPQWTQSGPFIEEEIPILHHVRDAGKTHFRGLSQKSKLCAVGGEYSKEVSLNFKQKAMMRSDIKRSTNREVMLLREHRHTQCHY